MHYCLNILFLKINQLNACQLNTLVEYSVWRLWLFPVKPLIILKSTDFLFNQVFIERSFLEKKINNKKPRNHCSVNVTSIDCLYLLWFRKIAHMYIHLAGKKQSKHKSYQIKCSFSYGESLGRTRIFFKFKKWR